MSAVTLPRRLFAAAASIALAATLVVTLDDDVRELPSPPASAVGAGTEAEAGACPPGYMPVADYLAEERAIEASRQDAASDLRARANAMIASAEGLEGCVSQKRPEPHHELMMRASQDGQARMPGLFAPGAYAAALQQAGTMQAGSVPGTSGTARQYGKGPLISNDERYGVSSLGLVLNSGRVDDLEYDPVDNKLYAAVGSGGVWVSDDLALTWREMNGGLPTTNVYSVAWTPNDGGRLVAITGDGTFGGITGTPGFGAYYTENDGATWVKASGVPDGALGFRVAVNEAHPEQVYVATSLGLFRSTDGGRSFVNVNLPTGTDDQPCTGVTDIQAHPECTLANHVTDVVVQAAGGTTGVTEPVVVAAVGWRGGNHTNPDGTVQSPNNGIYRSTTGEPDSFVKTTTNTVDNPAAFTQQDRIGRTELGIASGQDQNHDLLYAIVQDAVALNKIGCAVLDAPEPCTSPIGVSGINTVLEGLYVSQDFGLTWHRIAEDDNFQTPTSGSALNGTASALGFQPGVQAWYNECILPDPTVTAPGGVPGRLIVCLEEVWQNEAVGSPTDAPDQNFKVIGRYFSGETCMFLSLGTPACPTNRPDDEGETNTTTTHPDQHSAIFVERGDGEITLLMGNDGGVYRQDAAAWDGNPLTLDDDFDNGSWGDGDNLGFQTLLPYRAAMARDGVAWFGLQDNGSGKIVPDEAHKQFMTFGGDGFFVAVDPDNSDIAWSETPVASMRYTTDGGQTWSSMRPPSEGGPYRFSNPFIMDPTSSLHLATGGSKIYEVATGPGSSGDWAEVFDLGTASSPGDAEAEPAADDPVNTMSAIEVERDAAYVGFCGVCDIINEPNPFRNGLATNVRGDRPQQRTTGDGWHIAAANGLPNRFITSIAIDPHDVDTVYVTLGGYSRRWLGPGTAHDVNEQIGEGHVFKSVDAGENFVDLSGNLPDVLVNWIETRGDQMIVGTEIGAFASATDGSPTWAPLEGVPKTMIASVERKPHDPNTLVLATYGRGVWTYEFDDELAVPSYERHAGLGRAQTAVQVSEANFAPGTAKVAVIARADTYADALAGVPLAWWEDGPILLTNSDKLDDVTQRELQRLDVDTVYLLGGTGALSQQVESDVRASGASNVIRVAGGDRFQTAARIAERLPNTGHAYVVEGAHSDPNRGWPDALAVGPLAGYNGNPILLVTHDQLPPSTKDALEDLEVAEATIAGGEGAVSAAVAEAIEAAGTTTRRISGQDRYATSAALAQVAESEGLTDQRVWLATGRNWPDALAAGPTIISNGGVLLLADGQDPAPVTIDYLREHSVDIEAVTFLGGEGAFSTNAENQVRGAIDAGPVPPPAPTPLVGEVLAEYGFEGSLDGWTAETTDPTGVTQWQVTPPGDSSGSSAGIPFYNNESTATLTSPGVDFPGGSVKLTFARRIATEDGYDYVTASWSSDGETYNGIDGWSGFNPAYPLFDHEEYTFVAPAGKLFIRFTLSSDPLVNQEGGYIDNVVIER